MYCYEFLEEHDEVHSVNSFSYKGNWHIHPQPNSPLQTQAQEPLSGPLAHIHTVPIEDSACGKPGSTNDRSMFWASVVMALDETGKTISTSKSLIAVFSLRIDLTVLTIEVIIPDSVPRTNCSLSVVLFKTWSLTVDVMKSRMFDVEPTTPIPLFFASIANLNISPGTSKCAVMYASP